MKSNAPGSEVQPDDRRQRAGASSGAGYAGNADTRTDWRNLSDAQFENKLAEFLAEGVR